jgi:hypothetical protein
LLMLHQGNPSIIFKFSFLRPLQLYAWINIKLPRQYLNSHIKITKTHMSHLQGNTSGHKTFCCVTWVKNHLDEISVNLLDKLMVK